MSWGGVDKESVPRPDPSKLDESYKKNADTHKMTPESVRAAGVEGSKRPPGHGHHPGEVLHQQKRMPFSFATMTLAGLAITGVIGYVVLYSKKKAEVDALDVAKVSVNAAGAEETRPRK